MDPVTLVTTALTAGAGLGLKNSASSDVTDAYAALRALVQQKLASREDGPLVLDRHELAPGVWQGPLAFELDAAGTSTDTSLIAAAQALMALIDPLGSQVGKYTVSVHGSQGVQIGNGTSQHNTYIQASPPVAGTPAQAYNERFAGAAARLAADDPAIRVVGAYDMALLADDWEERRQECIDMLCASLRIHLLGSGAGEAGPAREAHRTLIRLITAHLQPDSKRARSHANWSKYNFDFTGVTFDGADFSGANFDGTVSFLNSIFLNAGFGSAVFSGNVNFNAAEFAGDSVDFTRTQFTGNPVSFIGTRFTGGLVTFYGARFSGQVFFHRAQFLGSNVCFGGVEFPGGDVSFFESLFAEGETDFMNARFNGTYVDFCNAHLRGGELLFNGSYFTSGEVNFLHAEFIGCTVNFKGSRFNGGTLDLREPSDWSYPPILDDIALPAPGLQLPPGHP
jgi:uncharacterized protein YjbI with pentapeptide repeats